MLSGWEYIVSKQIQWAKNNNIPLTGSKGERGRATYTHDLNQNLFEPLLEENQKRFEDGNGHEVQGSLDAPAKMQALHSSSALGVNIFQYWQKRGLLKEIASACGFCNRNSNYSESIVFEDKYPIDTKFVIPPNIDVVFHNYLTLPDELYAVECKFSEAYVGRPHGGLKSEYLDEEDLWTDLRALNKLGWETNIDAKRYSYLDAAQLIKHILGLKAYIRSKRFKLLYLWYDVLGYDGAKHRAEVEDFTKIAQSDGINFLAMTYQELITNLDRDHRAEHSEYIKYLTERYI